MKRTLSFIIAVSMVLALIPSVFAEYDGVYTFNFNCGAVGKSNGTRMQDNYGAAVSDPSLSEAWTFYGSSYMNNGQFQTGNMYWNATSGNSGSGVLNIVIRVEVPKDGTYIPTINYGAKPSAYKAKFLICASDETDETTLYGAHNNWDIRSYVPAHASDVIGEIDMYSAESEKKSAVMDPVTLTAGTYNFIISSNGVNEDCKLLSGKYVEAVLYSLELDGSAPESVELSSDKTGILDMGDTANLTAQVKYKSGKSLVMSSGITYESLDSSIASVDSNGVVTAVFEGTTRIKATVNGSDVSSEIEVSVGGADNGNDGVTLDYNMNSTVILNQTDGITGGVLRDLTKIKAFNKMNLTATAPWCFSRHTVYNVNISKEYFNGSVKVAAYPNHPIFAVKVRITNKGEYDLYLKPYHRDYGTSADIYVVPVGSEPEASWDLTQGAGAKKVGRYDFSDTAKSDGAEAKIGKFNADVRGDYYVIFALNSTNKTLLSDAYHGFYIAGMSLKPHDASSDAEKVNGNVNVYIGIENGGKVTSNIEVEKVNQAAFGTSITASAQDVEGKRFAYWRNSAGNVIATDKTYVFNANTNTSIIAVYDDISSDTADSVTVYFYNGNRELLGSREVSPSEGRMFGDIKISNPSLTGYVFDKWSIPDNEVIKSVTRAVALYTDSTENYTLTFSDSDGEHTFPGRKYAETITYTASGEDFAYWKIGDAVISYDKTISVYVWKDAVITAVYEKNAGAPVPNVLLSYDNGAYFMMYNVPEEYTKIEAGILFSAAGTPTIGSYGSKAVAKYDVESGQFTASPYSSSHSTARAYLIFKDKEGITRIIYSD